MDFLSLLRAERNRASSGLPRDNKPTTPAAPSQDPVPSSSSSSSSSSSPPPLPPLPPPPPPLTLVLPSEGVVDLKRFEVAPSLFYVPDVLMTTEEAQLLECIRGQPWQQLKTRRLQCWHDAPGSATPFQPWLRTLAEFLVGAGVFTSENAPNHVLINDYSPLEGIMHHTDGPAYVNRVAILSLSSSCLMTFRRRLTAEQLHTTDARDDVFSVLLRPRSLLVFTDAVYSDMLHGIADNSPVETVGATCPCVNTLLAGAADGDRIERARRTSLTVRKMHPVEP